MEIVEEDKRVEIVEEVKKVEIEEESNLIVENLDKTEDDNTIESSSTNNFPEGLSFLDDKILPAFNLSFAEALLEISKNPKCVPFKVYIDRWKYFNKKYIDKQNRKNKKYIQNKNNKNNITNTIVIIDESLLPPFNLSLPVAITKIKNNPLCVPADSYIKKWNEIKLLAKYKKNIKT